MVRRTGFGTESIVFCENHSPKHCWTCNKVSTENLYIVYETLHGTLIKLINMLSSVYCCRVDGWCR
jgi:hypothetical protein